jgi:signal transduction histidine kinase
MALVTVCDRGKGVTDSDDLSKMFQPFYTTKSKGLGMGLAISRALVVAHGGKMWAEPNADRGISVHFTLPFVS